MNAVSTPMPPSLWAATAPAPPATEPLLGEARTGVAVVGAGFTGLSAALHLAEAGVPVTVLEGATRAIDLNGSLAGARRLMRDAGVRLEH